MNSGNLLDGFYQQLRMGRKYTGLVCVLPEKTMGRCQVK